MRKENLFIAIITMISLLGCQEYAEPEAFLLPEGYTGAVVVVFDQKEGTVGEYEEGRRIYHIPEDGILYTQFPPVNGLLNEKFYYTDKNGEKSSELTRITFEKNPKKDVNYILDQYDGGFSIFPEGGIKEGSSSDYPSINWIYFTIGNASSRRDSLRGIANNKIEKIGKQYSPLKQ